MKKTNEILAEIKSKDEEIDRIKWALENDIKEPSKIISGNRDLNYCKGYRTALWDSIKDGRKEIMNKIQVVEKGIENFEGFIKAEKDPVKITQYTDGLNKLEGGKDAYWWIIDEEK